MLDIKIVMDKRDRGEAVTRFINQVTQAIDDHFDELTVHGIHWDDDVRSNIVGGLKVIASYARSLKL